MDFVDERHRHRYEVCFVVFLVHYIGHFEIIVFTAAKCVIDCVDISAVFIGE